VTTAADQLTLKSLSEWEAKEGRLPEAVSLYRELLKLQIEAASRIDAPAMEVSTSVIAAKAEAGEPLLAFDDIAIDWALFDELFGKVSELVALPATNHKDLRMLTREWFDGSGAGDYALDVAIHAALKPFLAATALALGKSLHLEAWRRRICPICGGMPDFAFIDSVRGERWLVCSRCDAHWLFQRLECCHCGNHEQGKLAFFTDEIEQYRLYVCETCKRYLKAVDLRRSATKTFLPLERVLTLHLDLQAQEMGYQPGAADKLAPHPAS
jgi:FdhE protein